MHVCHGNTQDKERKKVLPHLRIYVEKLCDNITFVYNGKKK